MSARNTSHAITGTRRFAHLEFMQLSHTTMQRIRQLVRYRINKPTMLSCPGMRPLNNYLEGDGKNKRQSPEGRDPSTSHSRDMNKTFHPHASLIKEITELVMTSTAILLRANSSLFMDSTSPKQQGKQTHKLESILNKEF